MSSKLSQVKYALALALTLSGPMSTGATPGSAKNTVLLKNHPQPIRHVQVTSDGKLVVALDDKHVSQIWEISSGAKRLTIIGPRLLAFSQDAKFAFSGGPVRRNVYKGNYSPLRPSEVFCGDGSALWATNVEKAGCHPDTLAFPIGRLPITSAAFSTDGKLLVTASGKMGLPGEVKIWHVPSGKERLPRLAYNASAFYSPAGKGDLFGLPASMREAPGVERLALSPDGSTLASVYKSLKGGEIGSGTAKLWDMGTGKLKGHVLIPDRTVHSLNFTPSGKAIVFGVGNREAGEIWFWDVSAGKAEGILGTHSHAVHSVVVSPNGRYLASGCAAGVIKMWDAAKRKELQSHKVSQVHEPIWALAFTPDGASLVVAGGERRGWIKLWELERR